MENGRQNALLHKLALRDALSDGEIGVLRSTPLREERVPAGRVFVREGDSPSESCLMLSGYSARINFLEDGSQQISAFHVAGDFVDLHSLLLDPMDHSIAALTDCDVGYVAHALLREITATHPHLTRLLWLMTLIDASIHRRWLVTMGSKLSEGRLAHLFCEMYLRLQAVELAGDDCFPLPLTQETIGDALGLSVVQVNRSVRSLRERNLATWRERRVTITNWEGLARLAEFDPGYLNLHRRPR